LAYAFHIRSPVQVQTLAGQHSRRVVYAVFVFSATALSIGAITAVAYGIGHPLVVPSLGPTAFLVFNRSQSSVSWPRNIVFGHLIGALAGYVSLIAFGLGHTPSVVDGGLTPSRVGAAALSIALTSAVMILLHIEHGPAGATTLIVSLGFMTTLSALGLLMGGVVFLAVLGLLIDRAVGLKLPLWSGFRRAGLAPSLGFPLARFQAPPAMDGHSGGHSGNGHPDDVLRPVSPSPLAGIEERKVPVRPRSGAKVAPGSPPWLVGAGHGRRVFIGAGRCTVKTQDAPSSGTYSLLEVVFDPSEPANLLHSHFAFAETYFVLEGEVVAEVGTERRKVPAGSTIIVPVGVPHLLAASGRSPARCLCITDRAVHSDLEYMP
jgi:CBS domain-containing membrane protein